METTEVVIAGAGPTGLMLALELRRAGVRVLLVDGLAQRTGESRAGGLHARTMELLEQRGLLDALLAQGRTMQAGHFGGLPLDFSDFDTRHPHMLAVLQSVIERELDSRATESGAPVRWSTPVTGFRQDAAGVEVELGDRRIRAAYLIGCDGGRSAVRKLAGIDFTGTDATMTGMLADVELADPPPAQFFGRRQGAGDFSAIQFEPGWYRLILHRHDLVAERGATLSFEDFRRYYTETAGTDFGMHSPRWVSQFGDAARQAVRYRAGRVFLAGDAAHVHFPAGGQGQNLGIQDAVNLGWKLAAVLRGNASDALLDTYESERHPVAARVLQNTRAQTALQRPGAHSDALRQTMSELIGMDEVRRRLGLMITALDIRYDSEGAHPLCGRRVSDAELDGGTRVHRVLSTRPTLLSSNGTEVPPGWKDRVDTVHIVSAEPAWQVPGLGEIPAPAAVLVRPDGYVAWASDTGDAGLTDALTTWFGASTEPRWPGV
ncbi:FAD-dependent monooxygenase [Nocardia sp. NPDC050712]|uniref:FAD-dependent monooxygenase n=1 Tax=Nocardia sp. NPDC050712 TaxID=3155518 RepID=UPI0033F45B85